MHATFRCIYAIRSPPNGVTRNGFIDFLDFADKHCEYMLELSDNLHISDPTSWYRHESRHILERNDARWIKDHSFYKNTLYNALVMLFPEYNEWQPWRFEDFPMESWQDQRIQRNYFDWLKEKVVLE